MSCREIWRLRITLQPIHFSLYITYYLIEELKTTHHVTVIPVSENDQRHPFLLHIKAQFVDLPNVEIPLRIYDEQSTLRGESDVTEIGLLGMYFSDEIERITPPHNEQCKESNVINQSLLTQKSKKGHVKTSSHTNT